MQTLQRLFQRQTSAGRAFIPEVDGLRFIAILSVVLFHLHAQMVRYYPTRFPPWLAIILHHGDRGVRLFFVISGFILALPFARYHIAGGTTPSLACYYLKRLTRLEPPYIASLLMFSFLLLLTVHQGVPQIVPHLLTTLAYCHNLIFGQMSSISVVAWSLEVEVQFYILVPILTSVFRLRPVLRRSLLAGSILSLGILQTIFPGPTGLRWQLSIGYYLQFFLVGFILADLYLTELNTTKCHLWVWDALSLMGWPFIFLIPNNTLQWSVPILTFVLYWSAFHGKLAGALFRHPLIVCTGGVCYSIYLLHFQLIALATRIAGHQRTWELWTLSLTLITVGSGTFYLLIEKPCMNSEWPRNFVRWLKSSRRIGEATPTEPGKVSIG